jgi:hypothetical protein
VAGVVARQPHLLVALVVQVVAGVAQAFKFILVVLVTLVRIHLLKVTTVVQEIIQHLITAVVQVVALEQ